MVIDVAKIHEKSYGYVLRSGKCGAYKYWYRDTMTGKLYQGKKPDKTLIDNYPKQETDPAPDKTVRNPWFNYHSTNLQNIYTEDGIPLNKLGITSREELDSYESFLLSVSYRRIFENLRIFPEYYLPITSHTIKKIHHVIFKSLYNWAGEYRNVTISKEGFLFPPAEMIEKEMLRFDEEYLKKINYHHKATMEELAELLAFVSSEITFIHPFREGNGRVIRVMMDILSFAFDYKPINWTNISSAEDKEVYLNCMFEGYKKNYDPLKKFLYSLLESSNSVVS